MKVAILMMLGLLIMSSVWAEEVDTDCPAMNENREKIIKPIKDQTKQVSGTIQQ